MNNITGFIWQGLVNTLSGSDYGFALIGLLGLIIILGILFMRGADYGLILISVMMFTMIAILYGLLPEYILYAVYLVAGGIIYMAIMKLSGR
jgi:hypothetical protein